jgi:amidase
MTGNDLCFLTASELVRRIITKELSACDVMAAHLTQIDRVNPQLNAIVTLLPDRAMDQAARADEMLAHGDVLGPLHGLPIAHKDLVETKGIRTTFGSPIFQDFVPDRNALIVERLQAAGAITIGKTNTPEFGAGSQTFNNVFGQTPNPHNLAKTCGGSSGGAAVALATGMLPLADGSDFGGSLRNPASFCNVVGYRPTPGRVPTWPTAAAWFPFIVEGPMARTVEDVALMLSVMAGPDPRSPIAIQESGDQFAASLHQDFAGVRVAWSQTLGGLPVEQSVTAVVDGQRQSFESLGCLVEEAEPDLSDADEIFKAWRAWYYWLAFSELLKVHRKKFKDTIIWNIEQGRTLDGTQLALVEQKRTVLYHRVREFMNTYKFLVLPVVQVPPFDITQEYVTEIDGVVLNSYIDWMRSCYYISVLGLPAVSVPCGFNEDGLPVGVQIVGRYQEDLAVLQFAYAFQQVTEFWKQKPKIAQ